MSYSLLLLTTLVACVSARFTVPVPVHYEIEAQFQKQSGVPKMRWDPTNYLTYLAAVYSQCTHLYTGNSLQQRGRVTNSTAYTNLLQYFDSSLLPNNLIVYSWDVASDSSQDAGTVDRDIRKLFGKPAGTGALGNIANIDATSLRNYDRFGCSVETTCKQQATTMMTLVCIFGQTVTPRLVAGTGGNAQPAQPAQPAARPTAAPRTPATTRPRARPTQRQLAGGFFEVFGDSSSDLYDSIVNEWTAGDTPQNFLSSEVIPFEQKLTAIGLCKYENNPSGFTASLLSGNFDTDAQATLFGAVPDSLPSQQDMTAPLSDAASNAIRNAIGQRMGAPATPGSSIACSWAVCTQKVLVGCAVWGTPSEVPAEEER